MAAPQQRSTAAAPKCFLLPFIYCLGKGSLPSWCHLAELFKEAVDQSPLRGKQTNEHELFSWLPSFFYFDSSGLQITPMSGTQNALRDVGDFSYRHWSFRTCLLTIFKRQSQRLTTKGRPILACVRECALDCEHGLPNIL